MPFIGGLISGAGSLLGGIFGGNAASSAANTQANAANRATDLQAQVLQGIREQLRPYLEIGTGALPALANLFGAGDPTTFNPNAPYLQPISSVVGAPPNPNDPALRNAFMASPGFQYQLDQSSNAIQNSAAGKTGALSGNMLKALQTNATGLASQDWWTNYNAVNNNYANRYNDVANNRSQVINAFTNLTNLGANAAAGAGAAGTNFANAAGNNIIGAGNAIAAGQVGSANALSGGINGLINSLTNPGGGGGGGSFLNYLIGGSGGSGGPAYGYNQAGYPLEFGY